MNKKIKQKNFDEVPLDNYERELEEFLERGEFVSDPDFEKNKPRLVEAAKQYFKRQENKESKSITLRVKNKDLIKLRAKAASNNIPYQTLIGLLINNYTRGKTKLTL